MGTNAKHRVDKVKMVALPKYVAREQGMSLGIPKPCSYMEYVLVLPLASRTPLFNVGLEQHILCLACKIYVI